MYTTLPLDPGRDLDTHSNPFPTLQALTIHAVGAPGEHDLTLLASRVLTYAALMVPDEPDAAAAIVSQLLPPMAQ